LNLFIIEVYYRVVGYALFDDNLRLGLPVINNKFYIKGEMLMKNILFSVLSVLFLTAFSGSIFGEDKGVVKDSDKNKTNVKEKKIAFYVIPIEKGKKDTRFYPLFEQAEKEKVLYYLEPMEGKVKSYTPKKDDMGMDYIPFYVDESSKKLVYYVNPMDIKIKSDKPKKDDMGMDFIPVYEAKVYKK